jgi:hypothetical protein
MHTMRKSNSSLTPLANKQNGMMKRIGKLAMLFMLGASMSACAGLPGSKGWKEEVLLHDGRVLVVERHFNLGGYPTLDARERRLLDESITFILPDTKKVISWKSEYDDRVPEPNSLSALLLDVVGGVPYLATGPAGCIAYNKWGRPNPPYILFKYTDGAWQQIPLQEFPAELVEVNLMNMPDSRLLKPYYTVGASKAKRSDGNVSAYAKTILRVPTPSAGGPGVGCPEMIRKGNGGWDGIGWFRDQPSKEACFKYCEQKEVAVQDCPCNRLFKGK